MMRNMIFLTNLLVMQNLKMALKEKQKFHTILLFLEFLEFIHQNKGPTKHLVFLIGLFRSTTGYTFSVFFLNPCSDVL